MKCDFCGAEIPYEQTQCPSCGAPCQYIERPKTVSAVENKVNICMQNAKVEKEYDDYVPMGASDVSFLKEAPKQEEKISYSGCWIWGIFAFIFVIVILIICAN